MLRWSKQLQENYKGEKKIKGNDRTSQDSCLICNEKILK